MNINLPIRQNEMLRTQPMPPGMLNINGPSFLNAAQQGQQQSQPPHMGMLPANSNPAMAGLLMQPGGPGTPNYPLQMQQAQAQRRPFMSQGPHATQGMNPALGPGPSHVNGLGPNQLPPSGFQNPMMQPNGIRRVQSQPQGLNQAGGPLGMNMHTGQQMMQGGGALNGMGSMTMPPQIRQMPQQQMRLAQPLPGPGGAMANDLQMGMVRAPGMTGGPSYASHITRTPSQNQSMPNIPQPPALPQSHPGTIQQPSFPGGMSLGPHMHSQQPQQLGSSSHPSQQISPGGMSVNMQGGPGPQASATARRMTPDAMFTFSNQHTQLNGQPGVPRMNPGNVQLGGFNSSSASNPQLSQNQPLGDIPQSLTGGPLGTPRAASSQGLIVTPAQVSQALSNDNLQHAFTMPRQGTPGNAPPRPPSVQRHFQMQQPQQSMQPPMGGVHRSPRQTDHLVHQMQPQPRPQSQPQVPQGHSPQRGGPSGTPRMQHPQLTSTNMPNRTPKMTPTQPQGPIPPPKPPTPSISHSQQVNAISRPPQAAPTITSQAASGANTSTPPSTSLASAHDLTQPNQQPAQAQPPGIYAQQQQRSLPLSILYPVGLGQGLLRLLQFSGVLTGETKDKLQLSYWDNLIKDYFTPRAVLKLTLWKDNQRNEAKQFEIGVPILPRFFLVTSQSGVKSMTLSLDGARERLMGQGHAIVECVQAVWTYKYHNGYTVTMRGPMTAHIIVSPNVTTGTAQAPSQGYQLKFDQLQFDANYHDKLIALDAIAGARIPDSPQMPGGMPLPNGAMQPQPDDDRRYDEPRQILEHASIPVEPVNAFGIPQATMRCLELAESVTQMTDLIQFSTEKKLGPKEALKQFAKQLRDQQVQSGGSGVNGMPAQNVPNAPGGPGMFDGLPHSTSSTLFTGAQQPGPSQLQPPPATPQQNGPSAVDGTPKQSKAIPQTPSQASASTPSASTPATASTPTGATMTPSLQSQSLKRKAGESSSPSIANAEQQPSGKRARAKRRGTATG